MTYNYNAQNPNDDPHYGYDDNLQDYIAELDETETCEYCGKRPKLEYRTLCATCTKQFLEDDGDTDFWDYSYFSRKEY